jgi:bacillithiol biosynthesis deacetylase BshB1
MKLDILVFGAHPDDIELSCGGTIIKHINNGFKVGIVDLTQGELGTRGDAKTRLEEASEASKIMGVHLRENLNFADGFFANNKNHQISIIKKIREYQPDIIITNAPSDRHPDHGRASQLTIDSTFLSGLEKINTNQAVWRPSSIYHYIQFNSLEPNIFIDISDTFDEKLKAVKAYKSQFYDPSSSESQTVISSKGFLESIEYRAKDLGRQAFCKYAEGFIAHQVPKVNLLSDIK